MAIRRDHELSNPQVLRGSLQEIVIDRRLHLDEWITAAPAITAIAARGPLTAVRGATPTE